MADAGIGNQTLHILLGERYNRAVDNADDGQNRDIRSEFEGSFWKER